MSGVGWWLLPVTLGLVLGWYLSYSAGRLDRLHHKVESSRAALDAQLVRRAAAAVEVAQLLDPASGLLLTDAAARALSAGEADHPGTDHPGTDHPGTDHPGQDRDPLAVPPHLEEAENNLSRALALALDDPESVRELAREPLTADAVAVLAQACTRVQLARRFHNDAVAQALRVRRKRVVRWARLAGYAPLPQMIEIDDALPPALSR